MIVLATFTGVVAVSTNIMNLIQPVQPSAAIPAAMGFKGYLGLWEFESWNFTPTNFAVSVGLLAGQIMYYNEVGSVPGSAKL